MSRTRSTITPAALTAAASGDLENFIAASTSGGIEAQEKRGQQSLCAKMDDRLPIDGTKSPEDRKAFEKMGFKFADKPEDELFISAAFPPGWTKKSTDHSMWSRLVDNHVRERASIFYKAAFYDRSAHIHLIRRFNVDSYHGCGKDIPGNVVVTDCGNVLKDFGTRPKDYDAAKNLHADAEAWLSAERPDWKDATAYWD